MFDQLDFDITKSSCDELIGEDTLMVKQQQMLLPNDFFNV